MPGIDDRRQLARLLGVAPLSNSSIQDHEIAARRLDQAERRRGRDARRRHLAHDQHADDAQQGALAAPMHGAQHGQARAVERGVVRVREDDPQRHREGRLLGQHDEPPDLGDHVADQLGAVDRVGPRLDLRQLDRPALAAVASLCGRAALTAASSMHTAHAEPLRLRLAGALVLVRRQRREPRDLGRELAQRVVALGGRDRREVGWASSDMGQSLRLDALPRPGRGSNRPRSGRARRPSKPLPTMTPLICAATRTGSSRPALASASRRQATTTQVGVAPASGASARRRRHAAA